MEGMLTVVRLLLQHKAKSAIHRGVDSSLLYHATNKQNLEMVKCLLDAGADPNESTVNGMSALALARRCEYHPIVKLLEANGARDIPNAE